MRACTHIHTCSHSPANNDADSSSCTLNRLMAKYYPNMELRVYFKNASNISRLFHVKDATPRVLKSKVVYRYSCAGCNAGYIGKLPATFMLEFVSLRVFHV